MKEQTLEDAQAESSQKTVELSLAVGNFAEAYGNVRYLQGQLAVWKEIRRSYPKKNARGFSVSKLTLADIDRKIGEFKG